MKLTQDPRQNGDISQRHANHLVRMQDLSLARKAGVTEKLTRSLREAVETHDVSRLNGMEVGKDGAERAKYAFKAENLWRLEKVLGPEHPYTRAIEQAFAQRAHENGEGNRPGRADLRGPVSLEQARKQEFAASDSFFHRLGSKVSKESSEARVMTGLKQAALSVGEGLRRGLKGTRNIFGGSNMRHGQEYEAARNYISRLQSAADDEDTQRGPTQREELDRRLQLGQQLRQATTSPERRRLVKEILRKDSARTDAPPAASRLDRHNVRRDQPLDFNKQEVAGNVTKNRAQWNAVSQELSLAAKAGVSRQLVRTLAGVFADPTAGMDDPVANVIAQLNSYHDVHGKFLFKAEHLWRVQNFLSTRDQRNPPVELLREAVDGALEKRRRVTGSESARGVSADELKRHFLASDSVGSRFGKLAKEAAALSLAHQTNHAARATGEYLRRGVKSTKNWTGGGREARHNGEYGHVHNILEARLARSTDPRIRARVQAELDAMGPRGNPNRQAVRDLYNKYSSEKRALAKEAKQDARDAAAEQARVQALEAQGGAREEERPLTPVLDPQDQARRGFLKAYMMPPLSLDPAVAAAAYEAEQLRWKPTQREEVANQALDYLLHGTSANGRAPAFNEPEPFRSGYERRFALAAVPLLQNGTSLPEISHFMGRDGLRPFGAQEAIDALLSAMDAQIDLDIMGPNDEALEAYHGLDSLNRFLNDDDTVAFPRGWIPDPDNGALHIPELAGSVVYREGGALLVGGDGLEYNILDEGVDLNSGWRLLRTGDLRTPNGWLVKLPEEELLTPNNERALDLQAAWSETWENYLDEALENPPSQLERRVADLLNGIAHSHASGEAGAILAARNMFIRTPSYDGSTDLVAISAFLKAHAVNRAHYDAFEPNDTENIDAEDAIDDFLAQYGTATADSETTSVRFDDGLPEIQPLQPVRTAPDVELPEPLIAPINVPTYAVSEPDSEYRSLNSISISSIGSNRAAQTQATSLASPRAAFTRPAPVGAPITREPMIQMILDNYVARIRKTYNIDSGRMEGGYDAGPVEVQMAALILHRNIHVLNTDGSRSDAHAPVFSHLTEPALTVMYRPGHFMAAVPNDNNGGLKALDLGTGAGGADCFYLAAAYHPAYSQDELQEMADDLRRRVANQLEDILSGDPGFANAFVEEILDNTPKADDRPVMSHLRRALGAFALMPTDDIISAEIEASQGRSTADIIDAYHNAFDFFLTGSRTADRGSAAIEQQLSRVQFPHYVKTDDPNEQIAFLEAARAAWLSLAANGAPRIA